MDIVLPPSIFTQEDFLVNAGFMLSAEQCKQRVVLLQQYRSEMWHLLEKIDTETRHAQAVNNLQLVELLKTKTNYLKDEKRRATNCINQQKKKRKLRESQVAVARLQEEREVAVARLQEERDNEVKRVKLDLEQKNRIVEQKELEKNRIAEEKEREKLAIENQKRELEEKQQVLANENKQLVEEKEAIVTQKQVLENHLKQQQKQIDGLKHQIHDKNEMLLTARAGLLCLQDGPLSKLPRPDRLIQKPDKAISKGKPLELGRGGFGVVFLVHLNGIPCVFKKQKLDRKKGAEIDKIKQEGAVQLVLGHQGFAPKVFGYWNDNFVAGLVMELIQCGHLASSETMLLDGYSMVQPLTLTLFDYFHYVREGETVFCNKRVSEFVTSFYLMHDAVLAIQFMHEKLLLHTDIKSDNFAIHFVPGYMGRPRTKILDMGLAVHKMAAQRPELTRKETIEYDQKTYYWNAPELIHDKAPAMYSVQSDIYSLGTLLGKAAEIYEDDQVSNAVRALFTSLEAAATHKLPRHRPAISELIREFEQLKNNRKLTQLLHCPTPDTENAR